MVRRASARGGGGSGETDPQLKQFIFIATITDTVCQLKKNRCTLKEENNSDLVSSFKFESFRICVV